MSHGGALRDLRIQSESASDAGSALPRGSSPYVYEGGETRLVAVRHACSLDDLRAALTKVSSRVTDLGVRYELPSEPGVLVDLVDDDDVALMFTELDEAAEVAGGVWPRLKLYVGGGHGTPRGTPASSLDDAAMRASQPSCTTPRHSSESMEQGVWGLLVIQCVVEHAGCCNTVYCGCC